MRRALGAMAVAALVLLALRERSAAARSRQIDTADEARSARAKAPASSLRWSHSLRREARAAQPALAFALDPAAPGEADLDALARWVEAEPAAALIWIEAQPWRQRAAALRDRAATLWAARDFRGALSWAQAASDDERDRLLASIAIGQAETDPAAAAAFAGAAVTAVDELKRAYEGIATVWAQRDPAAAATWALQNGVGDDPQRLAELVLYPWFGENPDAVKRWVGSLVDAPHDALWARLAAWQAEKDPVAAGAIVAQISDPTLRGRTAVSLIRRWARDDYDVAGEWALHLDDTTLRRRLVGELLAIAHDPGDACR